MWDIRAESERPADWPSACVLPVSLIGAGQTEHWYLIGRASSTAIARPALRAALATSATSVPGFPGPGPRATVRARAGAGRPAGPPGAGAACGAGGAGLAP